MPAAAPLIRAIALNVLWAFAAAAETSPPPSTAPLLSEADYGLFRLEGSMAQNAQISVQPFHELNCTSSLVLTTTAACTTPYGAQASQSNRQAIRKGDVLLAHFYLRTLQSSLESGEGLTELVVENAQTFSKCLQFAAGALKDWREFTVPFVADADYSPGQVSIIFRIGYQPQSIEIAGLTIRNLGSRENLANSSTGLARLHYPGQAPDAPWRAEADQRIEKIRKADLTIQVVDETGKPIPEADLTIQQTRHSYWFGSAIRSDHLVQGNAEAQAKYRDAISAMFNVVTFENELKWPFWSRDLDATLASLKWLNQQGIALRGHVLVWPSHGKGLPEPLYGLMENPDKLRQGILDHIREVTAKVQPPAAAWDVLNETFNNHEFMDLLGRSAMVSWFEAARQGSPQSRLFINDWGIVTSRGTDSTHQDDYEKTIAYLLENKAPLDGIGMQGHFGREPTPPERLLEALNRFGQFGKEIQLTEYSSQFSDPQEAADYLHDCLTVFFSQPATTGFILWGFADGIGMKNQSFLYDKDWNLTPSGKVWQDLVFGKWWTKTDATTAGDGRATVRGFQGDYSVTARHQGLESHAAVELKPGGATLKIVLQTPDKGGRAKN